MADADARGGNPVSYILVASSLLCYSLTSTSRAVYPQAEGSIPSARQFVNDVLAQCGITLHGNYLHWQILETALRLFNAARTRVFRRIQFQLDAVLLPHEAFLYSRSTFTTALLLSFRLLSPGQAGIVEDLGYRLNMNAMQAFNEVQGLEILLGLENLQGIRKGTIV